MANKRILVTGAAGQLGQAVMDVFASDFEILGTDVLIPEGHKDIHLMDISNPESIAAVLKEFNPDVVLNLAAMTNVDGCEREPEKAQLLNCTAVRYLRDAFDGKLVHISTDYVFDGNYGPYNETDHTNPINVYGRTKKESEDLVAGSPKPYLIIRTNVVFDYTETQASFAKWVVDSLREGKNIRVVDDQWNNPTWTVDLAQKIAVLIQVNASGCVHYGGADYLNRYRFAQKIANRFKLDVSLISRIKTSDLKQDAPRPLRGGLFTEYIQMEYGLIPLPIHLALDSIAKRMGQ